jgi:nucleotide-binding universal stress UspA family protein
MDTAERNPVLVAVGDEDDHDAAVRFGAAEAVREGRPLSVVHVIHPPALGPGPEQMLLTFAGADLVGNDLLQAAVDRAEKMVDGRVPVTRTLRHGPVVPALVELSKGADRVVLQHRRLSGPRRVFTGSVCSGVAARAPVPVVSVPELWVHPGAGGIVVGIQDTTGNHAVLEQAFALAAVRDCALTVLHAWTIPMIFDDAMLRPPVAEEAREELRVRIEHEMAVWRACHTTVDVRLDLPYARPADALVAASDRSALLVLGRRSASSSVSRLGPVTRALLRLSRCPVMVLPIASAHRHTRATGADRGRKVQT